MEFRMPEISELPALDHLPEPDEVIIPIVKANPNGEINGQYYTALYKTSVKNLVDLIVKEVRIHGVELEYSENTIRFKKTTS